MARSSPEKLAQALRANLKRRKQIKAGPAKEQPPDRPKPAQQPTQSPSKTPFKSEN